tara:strand:+ start:903 stop:1409 length:507 start_codon:yes stop_codon:yes gene_type:complete
MGLFGKKKKEEEIPLLPELPSSESDLAQLTKDDLPDAPTTLPEIETEALPELPEEQEEFPIPKTPPKPLKQPELPRTIELGSDNQPTTFRKSSTKESEPIYVRLDKFETTAQTFEEIKIKIQDIENLLKRTREIKQNEEQELIEWEREIQMIKTRIDLIDKNIFNKLD